MGHFAVIDIETNWDNEMMSIGAVVANDWNYGLIASKYFIIDPSYKVGGMFSHGLPRPDRKKAAVCTRADAMRKLRDWFGEFDIGSLYAYNATFDKGHLPELGDYRWHDIMRIAAYNQYNKKITPDIECCRSGRMKRGYGVEPITRMLTGRYYAETHNALQDAIDELRIMELLGLDIEVYEKARLR